MFCTKIWMLLTVSGRFEPLGFGKQWLQWTPSLGMRSSAQSPSGECTGYLPGPHETSGSNDAWRAGWSDCKDKKANGQIQWRRQYRGKKRGGGCLTWPCWSKVLLVSLSLGKDSGCFIQCLPGAGESGCVYVRHGGWGSAAPAISQCSFFHYREIVKWGRFKCETSGCV